MLQQKLRIIYPTPLRYDHLHQRPQQLLKAFSKMGIDTIFFDMNAKEKRIQDGITIVPPGTRITAPADPDTKTILWVTYPPGMQDYIRIPHDYMVFDIIDEPVGEFRHWQDNWVYLCKHADCVFASSLKLEKLGLEYRKDVNILSNGCDWNHFKSSTRGRRILENPNMKNCSHKIGFIGALADWLDWELLKYIAFKRPDYQFEFIGPVYNKCNIFNGLNVRYHGHVDYKDLPEYMMDLDVFLVPFDLDNPVTQAVNPIKFYEYLASGKPIVGTDMMELRLFTDDDKVYIGTSKEDFLAKLDIAVNENRPDVNIKRQQAAFENSWDKIALSAINKIKYHPINPILK